MPNYDELEQNLTRRGFAVSRFASAEEAAGYLDRQIDGKTVGMGGSVTLREMGLARRLAAHNELHWHWTEEGPGALPAAMTAQVYLSSVNALAETGEIINIDGTGNRVAATLFGHETVYLVVGSNKIAPDYDAALWRARNVAAPQNARRLGCETPCAAGDQCWDCDSPRRICNALVTLWRKPGGIGRMEVVLVDQKLGY